MQPVMNEVRRVARALMEKIARPLDHLSGGKITPDSITLAGLFLHIPIAFLIASGHNLWSAVLLIVFGLFDTLDGAMARVQGKTSPRGMLLDASTDRFKEALLYSGAAFALAVSPHPATAVWAAMAGAFSVCVSYVKAKGEAVVAAEGQHSHAALNKLFADGFMTFEVRMVVLILGLFFNVLVLAVAIIAIFSALTSIGRLVRISDYLDKHVKN